MANCSCDLHPAVVKFGPLLICDAPIVGAWLLAVTLGVVGGAKLLQLGSNVIGSFSYSLIFFTYAVMISSGLVTHCVYLVECGVQPPSTPGYRYAGLLDASLTSSIAVMFLYSGLVDMKLIKERSIVSLLLLFSACGAIFYINFSQAFPVLNVYKWSIEVCCGGYILIQALLLVQHGVCSSVIPITWLSGAAISGGGSFYLLFWQYCWLCQHLGPWSLQGVWYYGADVSMFFIFLFIWSTRSSQVDQSVNIKSIMKPVVFVG
ncbi:uncharacterized protein [Dysidea avara]|uniref:uncharacterized protein n=1 Tax=Dysidea avara TaxID=196820 RepID=UPI003330433B